MNKKIATDIIKKPNETNLLYLTENNKTITGKIFKKEYLKTFSTKFYEAIVNLDKLVFGERGAKTAFIYSNLVKVGIELFEQVLIQNGYLEFSEDMIEYIGFPIDITNLRTQAYNQKYFSAQNFFLPLQTL